MQPRACLLCGSRQSPPDRDGTCPRCADAIRSGDLGRLRDIPAERRRS